MGPSSAGFLYSDTGGSGPPVVFLHGVLMNGTLWNDIVDQLCDHRYRCIVPELPFGAHRTPMPDDADLTLESLVKLLAEFLAELDLRNVTLVCNDWGGAPLVVSPGGSDRVANLVLASCEAFDNYPPGFPRAAAILQRVVAGRHVPDCAASSSTLPSASADFVRRTIEKARSRRSVSQLDRAVTPRSQGPPRPRQVSPQRPEEDAVA